MRAVPAGLGNLASRHEGANVERLRGRDTGLLKIFIGHNDVLPLRVLVALYDVLPGNLDVFFRAEPLVLGPSIVFLVQRVEG